LPVFFVRLSSSVDEYMRMSGSTSDATGKLGFSSYKKKILGGYTNAWLWSSQGSCWWVHVHEWVYMHWFYALEVEEQPFYMVGAVFRACWWLHGHTWGCCYPRSMDLVFLFFGMAGAHKWYQRALVIPYIYYICGRQCPISELRDYGSYIHQGILLRSWYVLGVACFCEDMTYLTEMMIH
jgi:hypothetical protein